jgi:hypothetical protein
LQSRSDAEQRHPRDTFLLIMCRQFALVLRERRAASVDLFQRHVRLCRKVLEVIATIARASASAAAYASASGSASGAATADQHSAESAAPLALTDGGWNALLNVVLDACCDLLPNASAACTLGNALCAHLVRFGGVYTLGLCNVLDAVSHSPCGVSHSNTG